MTSEQAPITGQTYGEAQARQRTRAFLLTEAEKPLSEILQSVEDALSRFTESLNGVSRAQSAFAPGGEGEEAYSIAQAARHVAGSTVIMASRLAAVAYGEEPAPATGPGSFGSVDAGSIPELLNALDPARSALREGEAAIRGSAPDRSINHPAFGELNTAAYLRMIGLHIEDHIYQVAKIKGDSEYPPT